MESLETKLFRIKDCKLSVWKDWRAFYTGTFKTKSTNYLKSFWNKLLSLIACKIVWLQKIGWEQYCCWAVPTNANNERTIPRIRI